MQKMTLMEVMKLSQVELFDLAKQLVLLIEAMPDDMPELVIARANLDLVHRVLARRAHASRIGGPSL